MKSYYWKNGTNRLAPLRAVTNLQFVRKKKKATSAKGSIGIAECSTGRYVCIYNVKYKQKIASIYIIHDAVSTGMGPRGQPDGYLQCQC